MALLVVASDIQALAEFILLVRAMPIMRVYSVCGCAADCVNPLHMEQVFSTHCSSMTTFVRAGRTQFVLLSRVSVIRCRRYSIKEQGLLHFSNFQYHIGITFQ